MSPTPRSLALFLAAVVTLASCGSDSAAEPSTTDAVTAESLDTAAESASSSEAAATQAPTTQSDNGATDSAPSATPNGLDPSMFFDGALAEPITTEDCTLSGGAETTCYRITVAGYPASHEVGPFCPDTITDGADAGGIWLDGEAIYELSGQFFVDLPTLYGDEGWQMYDEDGNIFVTDTVEAFEGAARPDVDPEYQNHCVEGQVEFLDNGEPVMSTVLIPTVPVAADSSSEPAGNLGITLDGVVIARSAPVSAILGAYTIAAFDDCGGHFNPAEGYHLHGAVGCSENSEAVDGETPVFGYAMDGFAVHSPLDPAAVETAGLDECGGHSTESAGYHYHANSAEKNLVITCLVGQTEASTASTAGGPPPGGPPEG